MPLISSILVINVFSAAWLLWKLPVGSAYTPVPVEFEAAVIDDCAAALFIPKKRNENANESATRTTLKFTFFIRLKILVKKLLEKKMHNL